MNANERLLAPEAGTVATPASPPAVALNTLLAEPAKRPWYRRPLVWGLTALTIVMAIGAWEWQRRRAAATVPTYGTQTVARGNLTLTVTANGTLQPTRTINIGSELSGTVLKVLVDVNEHISKGQVMVELDTAKLKGQILRSRAALAAATALVAQHAATVNEAGISLGRLEDVARISGGQVPSKAELDTARATHVRALADATSASAGVADARAALSTDEINLSKASISAPADGIVLSRTVEPGNAVAATLQAVTLFSVAEDLTRLRLWVYVDEADVSAVKVDQTASFTVSAWPTRSFPAKVTRVGFGSTITDNVVTYLTYLDVDNQDLSLRPGMSATASIIATHRTNALLVPNTALRFTPKEANAPTKAAAGGVMASLTPRMPGRVRASAAAGASTASAKQVWVLPMIGTGTAAQAGEPVAVAVTPGISDGHMTEIVSGDLQVGMRVITDQKVGPSK